MVTGDHTTPTLYGDHSCEPVPFCISSVSGNHTWVDQVSTFDEIAVSKGMLGRFCGDQVMSIAKSFMDSSSS